MYSQLGLVLFFLPVFISSQREAIVSPQDPGCVEDFNKFKACMNLDHPFISRIDDIPRRDSAENLAILQEVRRILNITCAPLNSQMTCPLARKFRNYLDATETALNYYQILEPKCLANGTLYELPRTCGQTSEVFFCDNWRDPCLFYMLGGLKQCTYYELGIFTLLRFEMGNRCNDEVEYGKMWAKYLGLPSMFLYIDEK